MTHKNPMELDDYLGQDWRKNTPQPTMSVDDFLMSFIATILRIVQLPNYHWLLRIL